MKRLLFTGLVCVCLLGLQAFAGPRSATAAAQKAAASSKQSSPSAMRSISGTPVSSTATNLVIKTPKDQERSLGLDPKTFQPAQLKKGQNVQIQYFAERGSDRAVKVIARSAPAKTKKPSRIHGS